MKKTIDRPPNQTSLGQTLVPLTPEVAANLESGDELYHIREKDYQGWPMRVRLTSGPKVSLRSGEVTLSVKYGLKRCFQIPEQLLSNWQITESLHDKRSPGL